MKWKGGGWSKCMEGKKRKAERKKQGKGKKTKENTIYSYFFLGLRKR